MRARLIVYFFLLSAATCAAQSSYHGLTPGTSTRAEIEKHTGRPSRTEGRVSAYSAPSGSEVASIVVQYKAGSDVAERIEIYFPNPADRSGVLRALAIPDKPEATRAVNGKLVEYFGFPALVALTHAGAQQADGISSVGYYSRELYDPMLGKPAANSAAGDSSPAKPSGADQSAGAAKPATSGSSPAGSSGNSAQAKPSTDVAPDPNSALSSGTASSASSSSGSSPSAYNGPSSGTITWSGETDADQVITIEGNHTASGSMQGGLPGVPVQLDLDTRECAVVEAPAPSNGWKRLSIRCKHKRRAVISVHWTALQ